MSAIGLGIDLMEISRMQNMLDKFGDRAMNKLLTKSEQEYCRKNVRVAQHAAARVAAKEAAYKALQTDGNATDVSWLHIEVQVGAGGRPTLTLHGPAQAAADRLGVTDILISLSHSQDTAAAVVVLNAG
jgi:holo-[acyl-carrier protein] synthase